MAFDEVKNIFRVFDKYRRHTQMYLGSFYASMLFAESGRLNVHSSVDIRTPEQICAKDDLIIKTGTILNGRSQTEKYGLYFGPETYIKENCYLDAYGGFIKFEGCSAIGQFNMIAGQGGVTLGKYFMTGGHCYILSSNHICDDLEIPYMLQGDRTSGGVVIEENVWLGGGSIVLDGVRIGRNSIIAAGSIVARNIPPNSLYADRSPKLAKSVLHKIYEEVHVTSQ